MNRMVKFAGAGRVLFLFPLLAVLGPDALVLLPATPDDERRTTEETARAEEALDLASATASVDRLGWLAGCWEGTLSSGASYEEAWLPPRGGMLIGMARMTREGRVLSFEFMRIVDDQGTLVYAAQPAGREPTLFRAVAVASDELTLENPEHDFPQRIRYRLTPPDGLLARIEGERDGQVRAMEFPLQRTACP